MARSGFSFVKQNDSITPRPALLTLYKLSNQELALKIFSTIEILVFCILQISILLGITRIDRKTDSFGWFQFQGGTT